MPATATVQPGAVQRESQTAANAPKLRPDNPPSDLAAGSAQEDIAKLAYALWQRRGCPEGSPETDWLAAEEHLGQQSGNKKL